MARRTRTIISGTPHHVTQRETGVTPSPSNPATRRLGLMSQQLRRYGVVGGEQLVCCHRIDRIGLAMRPSVASISLMFMELDIPKYS
jgi:hypothetical protein